MSALLILVAGPYRSGTNDDPVLIAKNVAAMTEKFQMRSSEGDAQHRNSLATGSFAARCPPVIASVERPLQEEIDWLVGSGPAGRRAGIW